MGIENQKSTELEDLFASIVKLDGDGDKKKDKADKTEDTDLFCDFTTGVCIPTPKKDNETR